ncbi:hypothetical protein OXX79_010478 [Metschnikowia pulcherrima]
MPPFTLVRSRILVCVLLLMLVSGSVLFAGARRSSMLTQMRKYADDSGFNEFLDKTQSTMGETSASMKDKVADYLGNSQEIDPLDEKPLVGENDPNLDEELKQMYKAKPVDDKDASNFVVTPLPARASSTLPNAALSTGIITGNRKGVQAPAGNGAKAPVAGQNSKGTNDPNKNVGGTGQSQPAKGIQKVPETAYPKIPAPNKQNAKETLQFRIYSHNVKNGAHDQLVTGEVPWDARKRHVINSIKLNSAQNTIVLLQEPLKFQVDDIVNDLNYFSSPENPEWIYIGGGRIDGCDNGEHVPILLKTSEWQVLFNDTFWLNDGNTRASIVGWDARYPRIATYVTLQHKTSSHIINVLNTHFDHKGKNSKKESAIFLSDKMKALNKWPSFIVGDLNSQPEDAGPKELKKSFVDTHELVPDFNRYGHPDYSVTGFSGKYLKDAKRIDFIFAPSYTKKLSEKVCMERRPFSLQVLAYGILHSKFGGVYMSDHRPIMADFMIKSCS